MEKFHTIVRRALKQPRDETESIELGLESGSSRFFQRRSSRGGLYPYLQHFTYRRTLRTLLSLSLLPVLAILFLAWGGVPPSFKDVRSFERRLPQHNWTNPTETTGMYLRFPNHLWGHGLNNVLQETILMSYLAFKVNRSFVFEDYTWSRSPLPVTIYDFALRPTRIPLNAFVSGPIAGGPMPGPRAVSVEFWEAACPKEKRLLINSQDAPSWSEGSVIIDWWVETLRGIPEGCVEIDTGGKAVFDHFLFGNPRILSIWPGLASSPILSEFTWSPLVQSAVKRNFAILPPAATGDHGLAGLVAVHLRRGDFSRHCPRLAGWGSLYMGMNQHPTLPDAFTPFESANATALEEYYAVHCLPSQSEVSARLRTLRAIHPGLRQVYMMTNARTGWLAELRRQLLEDGWEGLSSSHDLVLDAEQRYVSVAVDMAIAEEAEMFVGNGFSSLTSNIVMLRMANGLDASTNRFL